MTQEKIMSLQEQLRADLIEIYLAGDITAADAAQSMPSRQCRRQVSRYCESGRTGVINLRRGKPSNYHLNKELKISGGEAYSYPLPRHEPDRSMALTQRRLWFEHLKGNHQETDDC